MRPLGSGRSGEYSRSRQCTVRVCCTACTRAGPGDHRPGRAVTASSRRTCPAAAARIAIGHAFVQNSAAATTNRPRGARPLRLATAQRTCRCHVIGASPCRRLPRQAERNRPGSGRPGRRVPVLEGAVVDEDPVHRALHVRGAPPLDGHQPVAGTRRPPRHGHVHGRQPRPSCWSGPPTGSSTCRRCRC